MTAARQIAARFSSTNGGSLSAKVILQLPLKLWRLARQAHKYKKSLLTSCRIGADGLPRLPIGFLQGNSNHTEKVQLYWGDESHLFHIGRGRHAYKMSLPLVLVVLVALRRVSSAPLRPSASLLSADTPGLPWLVTGAGGQQ
jgi:hypothetical protein